MLRKTTIALAKAAALTSAPTVEPLRCGLLRVWVGCTDTASRRPVSGRLFEVGQI